MFQDIISESWVYQEIEAEGLRKGLERGQKQGLEQGQKQGRETTLRQTLLTYIEMRYPNLAALAQRQTSAITDPTILNQALSTLFALQSTEEVEQYLKSLGNSATKN